MKVTAYLTLAITLALGAQACLPVGSNQCNQHGADCCNGNCYQEEGWEFGVCQ